MGKPRDGDDRVAWLLDHQRFDKALSVLETDRGLKKSTHAQVMASCVPWMLSHPAYMVNVCRMLLRVNAALEVSLTLCCNPR